MISLVLFFTGQVMGVKGFLEVIVLGTDHIIVVNLIHRLLILRGCGLVLVVHELLLVLILHEIRTIIGAYIIHISLESRTDIVHQGSFILLRFVLLSLSVNAVAYCY